MADDPELTVVMPVRDLAPHLPTMLLALERSRGVDLEVVAVDDGSSDATPDLLDAARTRVPGLRVLRHETPVGAASARNAGLDVARGRYVTFLDGDDWITPDHLHDLVAAIRTLGCDFVRTDHVQVRGRQRVLHRAPEARRGVVLDAASGILPVSRRTMIDYPYSWAGVYRRSLGEVLRFADGLHTATDRPWIWRLHRGASTYAVVPLAGVHYRREVEGSLTRIGDARQLHFLDAYAIVLAETADDPAHHAKAVRQFLAILAAHLTDEGKRLAHAQRPELERRGRAALAAIDPDVLAAVLPTDRRGDVLRRLLDRAPVRRVLAGSR